MPARASVCNSVEPGFAKLQRRNLASVLQMASALQKLLRRPPPPARIIAALHLSQPPSPIVDLHRECHPPTARIARPPATEHSRCTVVFPSFPFGFASNPILASGFCCPTEPEGEEDAGLEDSRTVWADSVKKKRKRKMNKHKYQKLRKRMRRQT